jgi:hypothetical protein
LLTRLRVAAERAGRDPDGIEVSAIFPGPWSDPRRALEQLAGLGVGRVMIPAFAFAGPGGLDRLRTFAAAANATAEEHR